MTSVRFVLLDILLPALPRVVPEFFSLLAAFIAWPLLFVLNTAEG